MGSVRGNDLDEQYSVLGDDEEIGFLDFEDESLRHFDPLLDEGPVIISMPFPFIHGKPQSALIGETAADRITIKNTTDDTIELWSVRIYSSNPKDSYLLSLMKPPDQNSDEHEIESFLGLTELEDRVLQPEESLEIWLSCKPQEVGLHTAVIHISVGDEKIERIAFVLADDSISVALAASKPFARARKAKKFDVDGYVPASHPSKPSKREIQHQLPKFLIPHELRTQIENNQIPDLLREGLCRQNYSAFFSTLLIMEEIHLEDQMRGFDMECVEFKRKGKNSLSLVIHGLAERRPSLVFGDFLFVKPAFVDIAADSHAIQGYICRIDSEEIIVEFPPKFHSQHYEGKRYDITFGYNRVSMRKCHLAIQIANETGHEILFPRSRRRSIRSNKPLLPFNKNLNQEQIRSVDKILGCRGAPPYIIYGPPGTGKTMTLVEAILQICQRETNPRILVCTPSNSAADHILNKLIAATEDSSSSPIQRSKIFRLNAASRSYEDVNPDHIQFCFLEGTSFQCPPLGALLQYSVIISTYMSSYQFHTIGLRKGHFGYILLDEAGQATEPETMVPLIGLCTTKTVVVLAGDPMQLGPVVCSKEADRLGLGRSYLQRLFDLDLYASEDPDYMTKLVRNYRSHPAILNLPSNLFYKGELIPCKNTSAIVESTIEESTLILPNKQFPVLFVGVQGCDEREGSSPSWFNRTEISKVVEIIEKLRSKAELARISEDIGIITPYLQQVLKLRKALLNRDMEEVKVGSVEHFQGQEKEVIILSTVRSTVKHNDFDRVHSLGFLTNPRRFNVAITRAKSLLVVIGNPHVICKDRHWDKLLRYCSGNGSYLGCPLPEPEIPRHLPAQDTASRVSEWVDCDYDESPSQPSQPNQYSDEVEWDEELPSQQCQQSQYSNWDEQPASPHRANSSELDEKLRGQQCSHLNEGEWGETQPSRPSSYSNKVEWGEEQPSQQRSYSNNVEWYEEQPSETSSYPNKVEWADEQPSQPGSYSNKVEWGEEKPSQPGSYSNKVEWDEGQQSQPGSCSNKVEWGEEQRSQPDSYSNKVEWGEEQRSQPDSYSNKVEWGKEQPNQPGSYSNKVEWDEGQPSQQNSYSNQVEWDEKLPSQPCSYSNDVEWDEELPSQDAYALPNEPSQFSTWGEKPPRRHQNDYRERKPPSQDWNWTESTELPPSRRFSENRGYKENNRNSNSRGEAWKKKNGMTRSGLQREKPTWQARPSY